MNSLHTILVVDDEPSNLRLMERLLHRQFNVLTAGNGEDALRIVERETISLIITDQRMPGMQGTELLRKCQAINPQMVSLVVTATNDIDTFIDAITNSGASRVINKPWDPDEMLMRVKDGLAKYERNLEHQRKMAQLRQVNENFNQIRSRR